MTKQIEIRKIIKSDNANISKIIKSTLVELGANLKGTAYYDTETDAMYEAFQKERTAYFVATIDNEVVGGCGIGILPNMESTICELQKMYILPKARGHKIGFRLVQKCIDFALKNGYSKIYLETFPQMKSAINLYTKNGFKTLQNSLGNTCHYACNVWMLKDLEQTILSLKHYFKTELNSLYPKEEITSFFNILAEEILGLNRIEIALEPNKIIKNPKLNRFLVATKQLKQEKPIQYIVGNTEFYGLNFKVTKDVLIPRPETEELVTWIIKDWKSNKNITILDIGTGSGCIAISLAKNLPNASVFALDVSKNALEIAKYNAVKNEINLTFLNENILKLHNLHQKFDVIVSNPPYVRELEKKEIQKNVLDNEPHLALFVKNDNALIFYDKISDFSKKHLTKNGNLYFEINQYLGKETLNLLKEKGFKNCILRRDIFDKDRMLKCEI